jgi:predicted ferric reductase
VATSAVTPTLAEVVPARARARDRHALTVAIAIAAIANVAAIVWIWSAGGADGIGYHWGNLDTALIGLGRLTALLAGYLALIQVLLLARLPFLERAIGFDRLTVWHRWNGFAVIGLVVAHVVFSVWGYAGQDRHSFLREYWNWLTLPQPASPYPGMITATVGTALLLAVVATSLVVVRRKLSYEWWYAVHFTAYAGIALSWFHMIPDGNELVIDRVAADYWRALFASTLALVVYYRLVRPLVRAIWSDLRVVEVTQEAPGVVSLRLAGRAVERLGARPGQFFFWRFLARGFWYTQHPFSLSEVPGASLRITVKALGDHTAKLGRIRVGTRVLAEGPFGVFTAAARVREKTLLIAGGIGITPVRALLEELHGDVVVLYRVVSSAEVVFREELDRLAAASGGRIEYVVGDHRDPRARGLLSARHLQELVPDLAERDVYVCGPPGLVDRIVPDLRRAGVPHRQLHVERFAL